MKDPFLASLPNLDVHGEASDTVIYLVSDFINDNLTMGNKKLVIIHGIGEGILKKVINNYFKKDKHVSKIYGDIFNLGITIIELK
ncbi:MAG: Smr/MutS family protein [Bacilli bacterium]|nr:Smr/MutS family protein [Bacilli bacterium]